ncbi:hypothetical protein GGR57DRAFT_25482 [Xylariaceae sp. FL1272]|nr:hypothetical protein GGR57DRAFT_25482 [Xylariaceae sp. FL1272]
MSLRGDNIPTTSPQASTPSPSVRGESTETYQTAVSGSRHRQTENRLPRNLGVHNILNPTDNVSRGPGRIEGSAISPNTPSAASSPSSHAPSTFVFPGQGVIRAGQTTPPSEYPPQTTLLSAERVSPGSTRPLPMVPSVRRILTPRSPRMSSAARGLASDGYPYTTTQAQQPTTGSRNNGRIFSLDGGVSIRGEQAHTGRGSPLVQQFSSVDDESGRPPPNLVPLPSTTITRSVSQPMINQPSPDLPGDPYRTHGDLGAHPRPAPSYFHGTAPHSANVRANYQFQNLPPGDARWYPGYEHAQQHGSGSVRSLPFGEGQAAVHIQPAHGEEFIVPVDTHQGSRQADEKRQRNAGASARFRKRRKEKEIADKVEQQRLENDNRELERRNHFLEMRLREESAERERVTMDRNRLRDIVSRTPSISELAYMQEQPSPDLTRSAGTIMERDARGSTTQPPGYGSPDPTTGERPAQRRRTEPGPIELPITPFAATPLPSMPTSGYSLSMSQPGTPLAGPHQSRLPPLRLDLGTVAPPPPNAAPNMPTPVQTYPPVKPEQGWATGPRGPQEPGSR